MFIHEQTHSFPPRVAHFNCAQNKNKTLYLVCLKQSNAMIWSVNYSMDIEQHKMDVMKKKCLLN